MNTLTLNIGHGLDEEPNFWNPEYIEMQVSKRFGHKVQYQQVYTEQGWITVARIELPPKERFRKQPVKKAVRELCDILNQDGIAYQYTYSNGKPTELYLVGPQPQRLLPIAEVYA